ncbi:uncharacterized protein LOC121052869 [Rosa chinensis]|uniref:uncharacterized protein LOC121052869 n=1 Tax=Rosa chinensis TaxID=74649 RepID=UPI001AD8F87E|nr:uncharacterized protein LOC121052869 [Rosa chinensis]
MGYSIWEIVKAFIDDHFEFAVNLYTQAITVDSNNSELYSDRTQANIKSNNLTGKVGSGIWSNIFDAKARIALNDYFVKLGTKRDFSTAILERKKAVNVLVVDEAIYDDNSVVTLHPETMEKL